MDKFEVEFYTKDNGEKPAKNFILGLDVKMRAKVLGIIHVLEEKGNQLREPYSKHLEDGIFEIRGKVGTDITRVLYFFYYGRKIVMTNGFIKKTQETPKQEFRKEWEDIQPEMDVIRAMVDARISQNLTQKELAERTGINQADISKLENGTRNPSLKLLKRLADGMGMTLKLEFVPKSPSKG